MKMKSFTDYLNEGEQSDDEIEAALKRALKIASEPERGEERKKVSVKKAPWDESVTEAGGHYTKPVYDMIEEHGIEKVMHELLTALDADVIQDAMSRMGEALGEGLGEEADDVETQHDVSIGDFVSFKDYDESVAHGKVVNVVGSAISIAVYDKDDGEMYVEVRDASELIDEPTQELSYLKKLSGI